MGGRVDGVCEAVVVDGEDSGENISVLLLAPSGVQVGDANSELELELRLSEVDVGRGVMVAVASLVESVRPHYPLFSLTIMVIR